MNTHTFFSRVLVALLAVMLLLTACTPPTNVAVPTVTLAAPGVVTATPEPTHIATMAAIPTEAPTAAPTAGAETVAIPVSLNNAGAADGVTTQVVPAVPSGADTTGNLVMPQYTLLTLQGYPISDHKMQPRIYVFAVKDLGVNEAAAAEAANLQALLQNQQVTDPMPYLPLQFSVKQVMHPQVKFLDFKNGKGARYLTEWHNGMAPINNHDLIYTFQGLTNDGQYYVAVEMPVKFCRGSRRIRRTRAACRWTGRPTICSTWRTRSTRLTSKMGWPSPPTWACWIIWYSRLRLSRVD